MNFAKIGVSLNRTATQEKRTMPQMHAHRDYELFFLLSGQRRYFLGHTIYDIAPGNLVMIPPNQLHRTVHLGSRGYDRYVVNFDDAQLRKFMDIAGCGWEMLPTQGCCMVLPPETVPRLRRAFEQMEAELAAPSLWTQTAVSLCLYRILHLALRWGSPKEPCQEETTERIQLAAKYINDHYTQWITLEDAAEVANMEKTYFSKRFKAMTGFGFLEYLTEIRLREAKKLLLGSSLSIGEISEVCGFTSSNYFGDLFRKRFGQAPSTYRSTAGGEAAFSEKT